MLWTSVQPFYRVLATSCRYTCVLRSLAVLSCTLLSDDVVYDPIFAGSQAWFSLVYHFVLNLLLLTPLLPPTPIFSDSQSFIATFVSPAFQLWCCLSVLVTTPCLVFRFIGALRSTQIPIENQARSSTYSTWCPTRGDPCICFIFYHLHITAWRTLTWLSIFQSLFVIWVVHVN